MVTKRRKNRLTTDALREVRNTFSRFLSILVLSALAVAFLAGLRATAPDMKYTADQYYDRTHLMDGYALSTLGITDGDLQALAKAEGVEEVEGVYTLDATATDRIVSLRSLPERLNLLETVEGRLPQAADECITDEMLLSELGLALGDTVTFTLEEEDEDNLSRTTYTIVGTFLSPLYVGTEYGTTSLGDGSLDGVVFLPGENFTMDYYTIAYFTGTGLEALNSYSDAYDDAAEDFLDGLEPLGDERAKLRYDEVVGDAQAELDDAQAELDDAKEKAQTELDDAKAELEDARAQLDQGWEDYEDGKETLEQELSDGRAELSSAAQSLNEAQSQYDSGYKQYQKGLSQYKEKLAEYEDGLAQYEESAAALDAKQAELDEGYAQYEAALAPYVGTPEYDAMVEELAPMKAQLDESQAQIDAARQPLAESKAQLDDAKSQLTTAKAKLDATASQLATAKTTIANGWADYNSGVEELNQAEEDGQAQLDDALAELEEGEADYEEGLADYEEGKKTAEEEIADAQAKLDDAQKQVDDIEECEWYVLGRNTNSGLVGYSQDAERVGNLASVFPIIFFLVAALACLTTMTRMVEEQRTQIGALKALGFSRFAISQKYIGYAFFASLAMSLDSRSFFFGLTLSQFMA